MGSCLSCDLDPCESDRHCHYHSGHYHSGHHHSGHYHSGRRFSDSYATYNTVKYPLPQSESYTVFPAYTPPPPVVSQTMSPPPYNPYS